MRSDPDAAVATARWLTSPQGASALTEAAKYKDLDSLATAAAMRRHWLPEEAAAALNQTSLRRKARQKYGSRADNLFFTDAGLQQATRASVARWRAERLAAFGVKKAVDLGCGLGADALAMIDVGISVTAVEINPVTAIFASANLPGAKIHCGRIEDLAAGLISSDTAIFLDPARRNERGQFWGIGGMSPSWEFACDLLANNIGCMKTGPGLPLGEIPDWASATWVSESGDLVELSLWGGVDKPGTRQAILLSSAIESSSYAPSSTVHFAVKPTPPPPISAIGKYLYEPDPAVIRAGGIPQLTEQLQGWLLAPKIGYISANNHTSTPFATAFEVTDVLPFDTRKIRALLAERDIGKLEIKARGVELDPAQYRKELKLRGTKSATLILTDTATGAKAALVTRLGNSL